jgi:hypothetical protein
MNLLTYHYLDPGPSQSPGLYLGTNNNGYCSYTENVTQLSLLQLVFLHFEVLLHRTPALITYWSILSCYCMLRIIIWKYCTHKLVKEREALAQCSKTSNLILSTFTLCNLEIPLLISFIHPKRNTRARFRPELRVPVPHIPWVLHATPKHLDSSSRTAFTRLYSRNIFLNRLRMNFDVSMAANGQISLILKTLSLKLHSI